ncbi:MAG: hypothetical protein SGI77_25360 [Pirellulaceae bacterium]|nr:hypothetical protein [Pirellulaceae bacterium]
MTQSNDRSPNDDQPSRQNSTDKDSNAIDCIDPQDHLLFIIGLIQRSRACGRLVLLGNHEDHTDNEIFDRLTGGGIIQVFELSESMNWLTLQIRSAAHRVRSCSLDAENFIYAVREPVMKWGNEMLPTLLSDVNYGPKQRHRLAMISRRIVIPMQKAQSWDRMEILEGLSECCEMMEQFRPRLRSLYWSLEKELEPVDDLDFNLARELYVRVRDVVLEQDDSAFLIGSQYEFMRPFPFQMVAISRIFDSYVLCRDGKECWAEFFIRFQREIEILLPLLTVDWRSHIHKKVGSLSEVVHTNDWGRRYLDLDQPIDQLLCDILGSIERDLRAAVRASVRL